MPDYFDKPYGAMPLQRGGHSWRKGPRAPRQRKERQFALLVGGLSVLAFASVFAWDALPFGGTDGADELSPEVQRLFAMTEAEWQERVWPTSADDIEAGQPQLSGRLTASNATTVTDTFARCASDRFTCVVDGDTLWYQGTRIRIADIDTPEVASPGCNLEREIGQQATSRLIDLLNAGPFELQPADRTFDSYGRRLMVARRGGRSLGQVLVAEGLAESWGGPRADWCGA